MAFDIEQGGQQALAALATCFAPERLSVALDVGASLHYARNGYSKKVFFGREAISQQERQCMSEVLVGLTAGGPPDKPTTVNYSFFIGAQKHRVHAHLVVEK